MTIVNQMCILLFNGTAAHLELGYKFPMELYTRQKIEQKILCIKSEDGLDLHTIHNTYSCMSIQLLSANYFISLTGKIT